jgi:hypothetical protein
MADPLVTRFHKYTNLDSSYQKNASPEHTENPPPRTENPPPLMKQGNNSSSKLSVSAYPHSTRNIDDDVTKDIEKTHELNTQREELWAKFSEKTEVNVVTKLESLSSSDIGELSKWLRVKAHPQINVLSISKSDIDDKAAKALAKAIKPKSTLDKLTTLKLGHKLSKLTTLELAGNTISDEGFKSLAKAIQTNHTITTLKIDMEGSTNSDQSIQKLAYAVQTNRTITKLTIWVGKKIDGNAVDAIAQMVKTNETIKELLFKGFSLTPDESKLISDAYKANLESKIESIIFN